MLGAILVVTLQSQNGKELPPDKREHWHYFIPCYTCSDDWRTWKKAVGE